MGKRKTSSIVFTGEAANDLFKSILKPEALKKFESEGKKLRAIKIVRRKG